MVNVYYARLWRGLYKQKGIKSPPQNQYNTFSLFPTQLTDNPFCPS
jgi:hypothetical protein